MIAPLLATAALAFTTAHSFRGEKKPSQKWLLILACAVGLIALWVQDFRDSEADQTATNRHSELVANYENLQKNYSSLQTNYTALQNGYSDLHKSYSELLKNYEALDKRHSELVAHNKEFDKTQEQLVLDNQKLREQLRPILEAAQAKNPGVTESEALKKLLAELAKFQPKIEFLPNNTQHEIVADSPHGPIRTKFFFQTRHPVVIRDARLNLTFDKPVRRVEVTLPNQMAIGGEEIVRVDVTTSRHVVVRVDVLQEAGRLEVVVFSNAPVRLTKADIYP